MSHDRVGTKMANIITFSQGDCVRNLQKICKIINGSKRTENIMTVVNDLTWWRLYWNPASQQWQVSVTNNGKDGWEVSKIFSTKDLISTIPHYKEVLEKAKGFEHKTVLSLTIYKVDGSSQP